MLATAELIAFLNHNITNMFPFHCCFPWPPCFEKFLTWLHLTSAAAVFFLSCSASDQSRSGNCHYDWCQVLGCGQALTFASFGYTSCPIMDRTCPKTNKTKTFLQKVAVGISIHTRKSYLMLVYFICWTLALDKLQFRLLSYVWLFIWVILLHVTINHFTFFCTSAALRPDSLSRQTWCELFKVSVFKCCVWWWWSAACGLPL